MLSDKGFGDFKHLLNYISDYKDSVFEIRLVKNDFPGEISECGNHIYPSSRFEIVFIFREFYKKLPHYATVGLEYINGEFGFFHEKYSFDGTGLQRTLNSGSMNEEKMEEMFKLLYETVKKDAEKIISDFDSVTF